VRTVLSDPEGGFYASQDADVTPEDEGGYFTWTEDQMKEVLDDEEFRILSLHLFHERGAMHHDPSKRVLFIASGPGQVAQKTGLSYERVSALIDSGKRKLLSVRDKRPAPFIDTTFYASINGMLATSFLCAHRVLGSEEAREFALRSLKRISDLLLKGDQLFHAEGVKGLLDDYVHMVEAYTAAYESTAGISFLQQADGLMQSCIRRFWDDDAGGFFDSEEPVMDLRLKGIEDVPHPSANSIAIMQLIRLYNLTGKDPYLSMAEKALSAFSRDAANIGLHASYYFCCLEHYFNMVRVGLDAAPDGGLAQAATEAILPYRSIVYGEDKGQATPCINGVCLEPITSPDALREFLKRPS